MKKIVITSKVDEPLRVDKYLTFEIDAISRSSIAKHIENGDVLINGKKVSKSCKVMPSDEIEVFLHDPKELTVEAQDIPLDIVYEDDDILVVDKPKGMVVHPAHGNYEHTLVNALLFHCKDSLSGINGILRPGIVHRIDKNTSGLLVVAKNDISHRGLSDQIREHSIKREYRAVVYGNIKEDRGVIDKPIGRNKDNRKKMCVTLDNSKNALTRYEVIKRYGDFTYIRCILETGRTHQIRVHMSYIGHPLAGDDVYGPKKVIKELNGQCLHAYLLGFVHPVSGESLEFTCDPPLSFTNFLNKLDKRNNGYNIS